jgi:asparagine synthase (glutamine-hydrolysing)
MCGLAGIVSYTSDAPPVDAEELLRIRERMIARGPDGAGFWLSQNRVVGLAHRRLAIIDLTLDGAQPMASIDGRYQIVFNGEIYNYQALRAALQRQGAVFRTQSDTEVLLQLYAHHGEAMCRELRGMYAFAIWDAHEQSLFVARDPFGIKPLYVHDDGKTLRLASQVKALLAGGAIPRVEEPAGHIGYWIWGHVPEPWTLFRDVQSLEPGTWLKVTVGGKHRRGVFESVECLLSGTDSVHHTESLAPVPSAATLRDALLDTVRHHLIADVPVGVFLSSGIDSATLAALAAECGTTLRTVTLGFEEFRGTPADETMLAEEVARQYGARHETVWIKRQDFEHVLDDFLDAMDQPSTDGLNTWLVSRAAADLGLKVAISGLGGDEFFGGYPSFHQVPKIRQLTRPFAAVPGLGRVFRQASAPVLRRFTSEKYAGLLEYGPTWEGAYLLRRATRMPWEVAELALPGAEFYATGLNRLMVSEIGDKTLRGLGSPAAIVSFLELTRYMRNQLLRDSDWAGMAHSLEIRVPLVDVELARQIARHRKGGNAYTKRDVSEAAHPALPQALVSRPKTGFSVPVRDWLLASSGADSRSRGLRAWQEFVGTS